MDVTKNDCEALSQLQAYALELLQTQKKLNELPQRQQILALREKKQAIEEKASQVAHIKAEAERDLARINDEDHRLIVKQEETQAKIDELQGDYRAVEAYSKELGGVAKRRNTLETELLPLGEKIAQIETLQKQLETAGDLLSKEENEIIASFQKEGGALTLKISQLTTKRDAAAAQLPSSLLTLFEKKAHQCGGVAVSRLEDDKCSVCRNSFDEGRRLQIQGEAPLSECPFCKRMMVVG